MLDIFGRIRYSEELDDVPVPYETDSKTTVAGTKTTVVTYIRYYNNGTGNCGIQRHTRETDSDANTENIKIEFAYAPWNDRTTATYKPINECWTLPVGDIN